MISSAAVAERLGRKPYETGRKSASKIGSSTSLAACWATRSRTVGMPRGRAPPSGLGMSRRRTGAGRYRPARRVPGARRASARRHMPRHRPGSADRPRPRPGRTGPAATPPPGRQPGRSGHRGRGSAVPGTAWPPAQSWRWSCCTLSTGGRESTGSARRGGGPGGPGHALTRTSARQRDQSRGPSLPARCVHADHGTTTPSDSRCPPLDFTIGLYERSLPDEAGQTGLSCSGPDHAHVPLPIPRRDPASSRPGTGPAGRGLRRDMSGSAPSLFLCRGCRIRVMLRPARLLPPKRLSTPRSARRVSPTDRGLLPGAPVPTRVGLAPTGLVQLSGRTMTQPTAATVSIDEVGCARPMIRRSSARAAPMSNGSAFFAQRRGSESWFEYRPTTLCQGRAFDGARLFTHSRVGLASGDGRTRARCGRDPGAPGGARWPGGGAARARWPGGGARWPGGGARWPAPPRAPHVHRAADPWRSVRGPTGHRSGAAIQVPMGRIMHTE